MILDSEELRCRVCEVHLRVNGGRILFRLKALLVLGGLTTPSPTFQMKKLARRQQQQQEQQNSQRLGQGRKVSEALRRLACCSLTGSVTSQHENPSRSSWNQTPAFCRNMQQSQFPPEHLLVGPFPPRYVTRHSKHRHMWRHFKHGGLLFLL